MCGKDGKGKKGNKQHAAAIAAVRRFGRWLCVQVRIYIQPDRTQTEECTHFLSAVVMRDFSNCARMLWVWVCDVVVCGMGGSW